MKTLTPNQQKGLKAIHLVSVSIWLTCVVLLGLTPILVGLTTSDEGVRMFVRVYHLIDIQVLTPAAVATLLTGLVYSLFTNWGFAKHGWILLKWGVTLLLVLWGTFHLGPSVKSLLAWTLEGHVHMAQDPYYLEGIRLGVTAAVINSALLLVAVGVSVYKPWKSIGHHQKG